MNVNSGYPGSRCIHAATLDDPSIFKPAAAVLREFVQPWDQVDPALDPPVPPQ